MKSHSCPVAVRAVAVEQGKAHAARCGIRRVRTGGWIALTIGCVSGALTPGASAQTGFVNWESPHVSPLALTPNGASLLAVNTADNRLEVFNVAGATPVYVRSIEVGLDPVSVRARGNNEAWVVNHMSDSISIVDLPSGRVRRTILTGDEPTDVIFAGAPSRAFVTLSQTSQLAVYDAANPAAPLSVLTIAGEEPRALAVSPDGTRVYAAIFESGNKSTIVPRPVVSQLNSPYGGQNPPPNRGATFVPPRPIGQPAPPPVGQIVRQDAAGRWMDDNSRDWTAFIPWGLHDNDVAIIDANTLGVTFARGLMTMVMSLGVKPDGTVTAIGTDALNQVRFEPNLNGIYVRVRMGSFNPAAPATVNTLDLNPHLNYLAPTVPQTTRDLSIGDPRGIVWSADGARGYVSGMGSNNVIVIDGGGARLTQIDVGAGPTGIALHPAQTHLYVLNKFDGSISTIDTGSLVETARTSFYDPTPAAIRNGRPLLYDTHLTSGLGQVSCASCHVDARWDSVAWDLGDPSGNVRAIDEPCRQGPGRCAPWHPMKGPMVTQTLVGNTQTEPLHWRGDRPDIRSFNVVYEGLQGDDETPSDAQMQQLTEFVLSLRFPPNPNRNLDNTLPTTMALVGGNGNAANGRNVFLTQPVLPGGLTCAGCHALPVGTDHRLDFPAGAPVQQTLDIAHLMNMHEKVGFLRTSQQNNRGYGFNHDSDRDTLQAVMGPPFQWPPGGTGAQLRRDVEAFMLTFSGDQHAAVGQQITFDGVNNNDPVLIARLNTFVAQADAGAVGLIAKGRRGGLDRGYVYVAPNQFRTDRVDEPAISPLTLRTTSMAGSEMTFTVVPLGTQVRIGVDRDADGFRDRDELDAGSDPADPGSAPPTFATGDLNCDGAVNFDDIEAFVMALTSQAAYDAAFPACDVMLGDINGSGAVDFDDIAGFVGCLATGGCP